MTREQARWKREIDNSDAQWAAGYRAGLREGRRQAAMPRPLRYAYRVWAHWRGLLFWCVVAAVFAAYVRWPFAVAASAVGGVYALVGLFYLRERLERF